MLIIVEGPDCAGKSSFIKLLEEIFESKFAKKQERFTILRAGPPTKDAMNEYITPLIDYYPGNDQHIICDRWHWGEIVYPIVFNRPTDMTRDKFTAIESFLWDRGAIVVYIYAMTDIIHRRLTERGDNLIKAKHVVPMVYEFITVANFVSTLDVTSFDTSNDYPDYYDAEYVLRRAMSVESEYE